MIRLVAKMISLLILICLIVPSCMYLTGKMGLNQVKIIMNISTIVWFVTASLWMWKEDRA